MAILNSGFLLENPMDLTEPLEKLIKVGFGLSREEPVEEIDVVIDDDEDDDEDDDADYDSEAEEIDLSSFDAEEVSDELWNTYLTICNLFVTLKTRSTYTLMLSEKVQNY